MRALVLAACAVLLSACDQTTSPLPLVGTLERDRFELAAETQDVIIDILVSEGDEVTADHLLARQDATLYQAQLSELLAAAERADQFVAELVRGPRKERIAQSQARVSGATEHLNLKRKEYDRIARLRQDSLTSQADLDRAYDARKLAQTDLEAASAALAELLDGTTAEQLLQGRAQADQARAAIATQRVRLARLDIRAPRDGVVEALPFEVGERPPAGAPVVIMLADSAPYARVYIPETLRARVTTGLAATIHVDGIAESFAGTVRYVASEAAFTPYYALTQRDRTRLAFPAEITLDADRARSLPTGVPVEVDFPTLQ